MTNTTLFVPGWFDRGAYYNYSNSADIWHKEIANTQKPETVIAHSLGALWALKEFGLDNELKFIFINPVLQKKNIFCRWFRYIIFEGAPKHLFSLKNLKHFIPAIKMANSLFKLPVQDILSQIPKDRLLIIYGENDKYLFDKELLVNFSLREIKGRGHNYSNDLLIDKAPK